jgi:uncharacterized protein involved in outer membrane biogenesis
MKGMRAQRRKSLLIVGGIVTPIIIAAITTFLLFDINKFKSNIESAAFGATGLDVRINGKIGLFFSPFGISAKDIHVAGKDGEILSLQNLKLGLELMPLLKKEIEITGCVLVKPAVNIVKDTKGRYNFENFEKKPTKWKLKAAAGLKKIKLSNGSLIYIDKNTGEKTELKEINLAIRDLSLSDASGETFKNISFTGSMDCKEVRKKNLTVDNVKSSIKVEKAVFYFKLLYMDIFGGRGEGDAEADKSKADAVYKINLKVSKLDFAKHEESFGAKKIIGGKGDLFASLSIREKRNRKLLSGIEGTLSIRGDNLVIYTMDLDKVLSSYETSKKFNLVDLGAFFIAGPLGTVALKGYTYGDLYKRTLGGRDVITHFISHWKIKGGVADATDCALATRHNRVALKGRLNLVGERYENVTVALLDDKGCAKFKQSISGPFGRPRSVL